MSIELTRSSVDSVEYKFQGRHVWPLRVKAHSKLDDMDSEIFVYHASWDDDPYQGDTFECVASVQQMQEIPKNKPHTSSEENQIPYYRKDTLQFNCRSIKESEELWKKIQEDVKDLMRNYKIYTTESLFTNETIEIE